MKKHILLFSLCCCFASVSFGQVNFGVGGTYVNDLGVQARANLDVSETLGLIPSFSYYFTEIGSAFSIDGNLTYNVAEIGDGIPIYALGGLDYSVFSFGGNSDGNIGINLGAGTNVSSIYGEIFFRKLFCDICGSDIGINVGYSF